MNSYWWVNQNKTYKEEIGGGYMWSPMKKSNGAKNPFYDTMTQVQKGDVVFSCYGGLIQAFGIVREEAISSPKPEEFGSKGSYWGDEGWSVKVLYQDLTDPLSPKDNFDLISPLLPEKYSPIKQDGGILEAYLCPIPNEMGDCLLSLMPKSAIYDCMNLVKRTIRLYG